VLHNFSSETVLIEVIKIALTMSSIGQSGVKRWFLEPRVVLYNLSSNHTN